MPSLGGMSCIRQLRPKDISLGPYGVDYDTLNRSNRPEQGEAMNNLPQGQVQVETMEQTIARLKAENEALKAAKAQVKLGIKVSQKGAVSVYGLGRFPITLYGSQWTALFEREAEIKQFLIDHSSELTTKEKKAA